MAQLAGPRPGGLGVHLSPPRIGARTARSPSPPARPREMRKGRHGCALAAVQRNLVPRSTTPRLPAAPQRCAWRAATADDRPHRFENLKGAARLRARAIAPNLTARDLRLPAVPTARSHAVHRLRPPCGLARLNGTDSRPVGPGRAKSAGAPSFPSCARAPITASTVAGRLLTNVGLDGTLFQRSEVVFRPHATKKPLRPGLATHCPDRVSHRAQYRPASPRHVQVTISWHRPVDRTPTEDRRQLLAKQQNRPPVRRPNKRSLSTTPRPRASEQGAAPPGYHTRLISHTQRPYKVIPEHRITSGRGKICTTPPTTPAPLRTVRAYGEADDGPATISGRSPASGRPAGRDWLREEPQQRATAAGMRSPQERVT